LQQPVIQGFTQIVSVGGAFLEQMNPEKYNEADSDLIFDAFRTVSSIYSFLVL
jgi:hypothetical protein